VVLAGGGLRALAPEMLAPELAEIDGADLVSWTDGDGPDAAIARVLDGVGRLLAGRHADDGPRRPLHPPHGPRRRARDPRAAPPAPREPRAAAGRQRVQRRARHLRAGRFGVRYENLVHLGPDGPELLNAGY
jgi:hypothetical protein